MPVSFFDPATALFLIPSDPAVLDRAPTPGLVVLLVDVVDIDDDFVIPLGSAFFVVVLVCCFVFFWAASQPAKSGSPLSLNDVCVVVFVFGLDREGVAQGSSSSSFWLLDWVSPKPPQSSVKSSVSSAKLDGGGSGDERVGMVGVLFCRVMPDFGLRREEEDLDSGFVVELGGGTEEERGSAAPLLLLLLSCIWPLADASLFVKDDIAQPVQEESLAGVPMRGALGPPEEMEGEGRAVSGSDCAYLRMRDM